MTDESVPENQELIIPDTPTEKELREINKTQIVSENKDTVNGTRQDEIDRMGFGGPLGFKLSVSGKNASQLYWPIGIAIVIAAISLAISNIIEAMK